MTDDNKKKSPLDYWPKEEERRSLEDIIFDLVSWKAEKDEEKKDDNDSA